MYIVISATIGATVLFLIAKTALGDPWRAKAGRWLHQMVAGFRDNALSYLLVLRLVPLFPFFVVNLVPAFLGVPLSTFVIGTGIGILTPHILMALIGLAVLALIPVLYKKLKARTA